MGEGLASDDRAIDFLCGCGHSLAKVIDGFNYAKFTLKREEVWRAESRLEEVR